MRIFIKLADNQPRSCSVVVSATTTAILSFRKYCYSLIIGNFEKSVWKTAGPKSTGDSELSCSVLQRTQK